MSILISSHFRHKCFLNPLISKKKYTYRNINFKICLSNSKFIEILPESGNVSAFIIKSGAFTYSGFLVFIPTGIIYPRLLLR